MAPPPVQGSPFTPEMVQYWLEHADDNRAPGIIISTITTVILAGIFVALRLASRWSPKRPWSLKLHVSDWLVLVALVFQIFSGACYITMTRYGVGRHMIFITDPYRAQIFSILLEASYGFAMGFLKLSVLSLYSSIFAHQNRKFHIWLWILAVFIVGWTLTCSLGAIFQCVPVAKAYDRTITDGYCIHYGELSLVVGICNVVTDFVIAVMPLPIVVKMQISNRKKRVIMTVFAAGCSAVIVSIVRLIFSLEVGTLDGSWTAVPVGYASAVELTLGFLVVSIPAYRTAYKRWRGDKDGEKGSRSGGDGSEGGSWSRYYFPKALRDKISSRKDTLASNTTAAGSQSDGSSLGKRQQQERYYFGHDAILTTTTVSSTRNLPELDMTILSGLSGDELSRAEEGKIVTEHVVELETSPNDGYHEARTGNK